MEGATARASYLGIMNRLSNTNRARIVSCLVEGSSTRAACRMTGISTPTILKLLADLGKVHDEHVRNVPAKRVQCDEIWSFAGAKMKNVCEERAEGWGDIWTWVGIDADSKLIVSYLLGQRGPAWAREFMGDIASRVASRIQITTDGFKAYAEAVEGPFGMDVDYAMLIKLYGNDSFDTKYSPGCITCGFKLDHYPYSSGVDSCPWEPGQAV